MKHPNKILFGLMMLAAIVASASGNEPLRRSALAWGKTTMPQTNIFDPSKMRHTRISTDDVTAPLQREKMRDEMRSGGSRSLSLKAPKKDGEKLYTVKCVFTGEEEMPYFAIYNPDFFIESRMGVWIESGETDTYYFQVPAGKYDIAINYFSRVEGKTGNANIIHEDIEITGDIEEIFSESELTEKVSIEPLLRNGEKAVLPLYISLEEEPWSELDYTGSTVDFSYYNYIFFCEGCEPIAAGFAAADCRFTDDERTFLSNKLSDKYHFIFQYFLADRSGELQVSTTDMTGSSSGMVNNYIKDFKRFEVPEFSKTPISSQFEKPAVNCSITGLIWMNDVQMGGGGMYTQAVTPEVYVATQPVAGDIDLKTPIIVANVQSQRTETTEVEEDGNIYTFTDIYRAEMISLPAIFNGTQWEYINQNHSECGNFSYQRPENGPIVEYPGVPAYCYFADQITQPVGNSSPVMVLMTQVREYPDATIFSFEPHAYIGRYGEVRNCDQWTLQSEVELDGVVVFDSKDGGSFSDWCIKNSTDGHTKGVIEASFVDSNVLVDDIPGFNRSTVKIDERNEDLCAPTLQMLIFKDTEGAIADRFARAEDGIMEFSAGDFNWVDTGDRWYYECEEADVKVEYAPYGEETFAELDIEEIPENYFMPGFGHFYRGSLSGVTMPSANGWYDLRFTLADKAGNEMVQHISPAFKISGNVSVAEVAADGLKVWSADGKVVAAGADVARMELLSTDGKLIAECSGNSLSAPSVSGIAIVRVTTAEGSLFVRKVILR